MRALLSLLDDPQRAYGVTHIAGTKGKGSTSALLASILRAAGIATGLYTQPDLHTFRERIQLDGRVIAEAEVARLVPTVRAATEALDPALGSLITYEVGDRAGLPGVSRGGHAPRRHRGRAGWAAGRDQRRRADGDGDHLDQLRPHGGARAYAGRDRAREGGHHQAWRPVLTSAHAPEALEVIARIAAERGAPLLRVGPEGATDCDYTYTLRRGEQRGADLRRARPHGDYADLELASARRASDRERDARRGARRDPTRRGLPITEAAIRRGLRDGRWPARLQVVGRAPWIVVDAAHNADSFAHLLAALRRHFSFERLILVIGVLADKDLAWHCHCYRRRWRRSRHRHDRRQPASAARQQPSAEALQKAAPELETRVYARSAAALAEALHEAGPSDLICVTGSVYFAGEALRWLAGRPEVTAGAIEIAGVDH